MFIIVFWSIENDKVYLDFSSYTKLMGNRSVLHYRELPIPIQVTGVWPIYRYVFTFHRVTETLVKCIAVYQTGYDCSTNYQRPGYFHTRVVCGWTSTYLSIGVVDHLSYITEIPFHRLVLDNRVSYCSWFWWNCFPISRHRRRLYPRWWNDLYIVGIIYIQNCAVF